MKKLTKRRIKWWKALLITLGVSIGACFFVVLFLFLWIQLAWKTYSYDGKFLIKYPPGWKAIEDVQAAGAITQEHPVALYPEGRAVNIYIWRMPRSLSSARDAKTYEERIAYLQKAPLFSSFVSFKPIWYTYYFDSSNGSFHQDFSLNGKEDITYNFDATSEGAILDSKEHRYVQVDKKSQLLNKLLIFLIVHTFREK